MKGGLGLQIVVYDKKLSKLLNNSNDLIKKIGMDMAKSIKKRFNQLQASSNFKEYLDNGIGKPHPLTGSLDNLFGISLSRNYRLIVEPLSDGLDNELLKKCDKVNVKGVADYHDGKCEWLIP